MKIKETENSLLKIYKYKIHTHGLKGMTLNPGFKSFQTKVIIFFILMSQTFKLH